MYLNGSRNLKNEQFSVIRRKRKTWIGLLYNVINLIKISRYLEESYHHGDSKSRLTAGMQCFCVALFAFFDVDNDVYKMLGLSMYLTADELSTSIERCCYMFDMHLLGLETEEMTVDNKEVAYIQEIISSCTIKYSRSYLFFISGATVAIVTKFVSKTE